MLNRVLRERSRPREQTSFPNIPELPANSRQWPWGKTAELVASKVWPRSTNPPGELHADSRMEMAATSGPLTHAYELHGGWENNPRTELDAPSSTTRWGSSLGAYEGT